jgi:tetratricopeptide (TPR) repeat protein
MAINRLGFWSVVFSLTLAASEAQSKEPRSAKDYYERAVERFEKGDLDRAIVDFNYAIELNPQFAKAYNGRAAAWSALGCGEEALADFTTALAINPRLPQAYIGRAATWFRNGDLERAMDDYSAAIRIADLEIAYYNRAKVREAKGDLKGAVADYGKALRINPRFAAAHFDRGRVLLLQGKEVEGQKALLKSTELQLKSRTRAGRIERPGSQSSGALSEDGTTAVSGRH